MHNIFIFLRPQRKKKIKISEAQTKLRFTTAIYFLSRENIIPLFFLQEKLTVALLRSSATNVIEGREALYN